MARYARVLFWLPLILYVFTALACISVVGMGTDAFFTFWLPLAPLGSFAVLFYTCYLALWKIRRDKVRRLVIAAILPFVPLPFLTLLDFTGVELVQIHHMALPNSTAWLWPGEIVTYPVDIAIKYLRPPETPKPDWIYVRGAMSQPDGSLILYGATCAQADQLERETFKLLGRLDAAGNLDKSFAPVVVPMNDVKHTFTQPDGTVLVESVDPAGKRLAIDQMFPDRSLVEIARVTAFPDDDDADPQLGFGPQSASAPVPLLPGWLSQQGRLIRLHPDGKPDEQFNAQARNVLGKLDQGRYQLSVEDAQGRVVVGMEFALLRLDGKGQLVTPGVVELKRVESGDRVFAGLNGLALRPDGSIYVTSGDERFDSALPRIMRFDSQLQEDSGFSDKASSWAKKMGRFYVLGFRADGGVVVSLVQREKGSRILSLGPQGQLIREVRLGF
jgi:hypothetical protein